MRQKPEVSLIPLSISKFLIFIPFTAASTLACWHGWCYFSFCKGNRFGLMQAGGGENRSGLPGRPDSVTISQTSIGAWELLSLLLIVSRFSFPSAFPNVFPQRGVTTSWHMHKWQMTDDITKAIRSPQGDENVTSLVLCITLTPRVNIATRKKKWQASHPMRDRHCCFSANQREPWAFTSPVETQGVLTAIKSD